MKTKRVPESLGITTGLYVLAAVTSMLWLVSVTRAGGADPLQALGVQLHNYGLATITLLLLLLAAVQRAQQATRSLESTLLELAAEQQSARQPAASRPSRPPPPPSTP